MSRITTCKECGGSLIRVSWSSVRNHLECKQKTYLKLQGKRAATVDARGFFPGTVTDRVVRDWLDNNPHDNPGAMPGMVEDIVKREEESIKNSDENRKEYLKWKSPDDRDNVIRDCIQAVTVIEESLNKLVLPFEFVADYKFETPLEVENVRTGEPITVLLNGYMDIMVRDRDGDYAVWDVKHTKDNYYWKKTAGQIAFYDLAIMTMFGRGTKYAGLLQPLCTEPVKSLPVKDDHRLAILRDIATMASDIENGENTPRKDNKYCTFCDFKHACVKFKKNENGRVSLFG